MTKRVVYLGHPLNAPTLEGIEANRQEAARWAAFFATYFDVAPECSWIVLSGELGDGPESRERGLAIDLALVGRCPELVMVGPRVSDGMRLEATHMVTEVGGPVYDLTGLPRDPKTIALAWETGRWFP